MLDGSCNNRYVRADGIVAPLPAAMLLVGSGLMSLAGWRWVRMKYSRSEK